jgi:hypothetical protein
MAERLYSLARLRRFQQHARESIRYPMALAGKSREEIAQELGAPLVELADIPADAEMDDATITYWDGERFRDMATFPVGLIDPAWTPPPPDPLDGCDEVTAMLSGTGTETTSTTAIEVILRRTGPRWLIWQPKEYRKKFATPYARHARATAEMWFGAPIDGWRITKEHRPPKRPPTRRVGADYVKANNDT